MKKLWLVMILVGFVVGLVLSLVPWPAAWVQTLYLNGLLPAVTAVTVPVVNAIQPSVTALLALLLATATALMLIAGGTRIRRAAVRLIGSVVALLVLLFPLTFGLGYRLPKLAQQQPTAGVTLNEEIRDELANRVLQRLQSSAQLLGDRNVVSNSTGSSSTGRNSTGNTLTGNTLTDSQSISRNTLAATTVTPDSLFTEESVAAASKCVATLAADLRSGHHINLPTRVKLLPAGLQLRVGFAGIVSPWLLEPHVDAGMAPSAALATALHELAHTAGFAAEAEAEAVGMVAGFECSDQRVAYAASLRLASQLAASMTPQQRNDYMNLWPARARADLRSERAANARYSSPLAPAVANTYDLYLRSQGQAQGINEYTLGTELALKLLTGRLSSSE